MTVETILQHEILTQFVYPFFLIFLVVYAILEKTNLLGEKQQQVNAIVALIVGLIFVSVAYPKLVVGNMILFLTVALVVMFVALMLWGFASGSDLKDNIFGESKAVKGIIIAVIIIAVVAALMWAMGLSSSLIDLLFRQNWSSSFWTNAAFIVAIAVALAVALKGGKSD